MNYKGFKKIHEDDNKAVLKNQRGHEITLAVKQLSKAHQDSIKKLPLYAFDGAHIEKRTEDQDMDQLEQPSMPMNAETVTPPPEPTAQPAMAAPQQTPADPIPENSEITPQQALQTQESVLTGQRPGAPAEPEPNVPGTPGDHAIQEMSHYTQDHMNGHIKAKNYQDLLFKNEDGSDKSFLGKFGSLFGLLLSGAGSGLAHQPNLVMQMMDNEIKNDLEAQSKDTEKGMNYSKFIESHILNQASNAKTSADIFHLAAQDAPTMDKLKQMYARRDALDKGYKEFVTRFPLNSPERQKAELTWGQMLQGANAEDMSAAQFVNSRWNLYKGQPGMMGGADSSTGPAGEDDGVNSQKWNQLERASQMGLPGAPSASDLESMRKEAVDVKEARQIRKTYIESFNKLNSLALAGKLSPNQRKAAVNALGAKMATLTSHRFNLSEAGAQAEGMFPAAGDFGGKSGETRQYKYKKGLEAIDALESGTPTLDRFKLKTDAARPSLPEKSHKHEAETIERHDPKTGKTVVYDAATKKPIRWK